MALLTDEAINIIIGAVGTTGGAALMKLYGVYLKKKDPKEKAEILEQIYEKLERQYAKDLKLQERVNQLASENIQLKKLITQLKNGNSSK